MKRSTLDDAAWRACRVSGDGVPAQRVRVEGVLYLPVRAGDLVALARWSLEGEPGPCVMVVEPDAAPVRERSRLVFAALLRAQNERPSAAQLAWPRMAAQGPHDRHIPAQFFAAWVGSERRYVSLWRRGRGGEVGPDGVFATWRTGRLPWWLEGASLVTVHREGPWVFGAAYATGERFAARNSPRAAKRPHRGCA